MGLVVYESGTVAHSSVRRRKRVQRSKACEQCGETFEPWNKTTRFCSRACLTVWQQTTVAAQRRGVKPIRNCDNCGDPYKQCGPAQLHCRKPECAHIDFENRVMRPWRATQERKEALAEARSLSRRMAAVARRETDLDFRSQERERAEREATPELQALIQEQARDDRFWEGQFPWQFSLDAPIGDEGTWLDITRATATEDPFDSVVREWTNEYVNDAVGSEESLARLNEESLLRLQDRLREEWITPSSVRRQERSQLQEQKRVPRRTKAPQSEQLAEVGGFRTDELDLELSALTSDQETQTHRPEPFYRARKIAREYERYERRLRKAQRKLAA